MWDSSTTNFVTAYARGGIRLAQADQQASRHFRQHQVADVVAQRIVDRFELVEVEKHHDQVRMVSFCLAERLMEAVGEQRPYEFPIAGCMRKA